MNVVVPLAGPDFEFADGSVKAEVVVDGAPVLQAALCSRSWWRDGSVESRDLRFVLRDTLTSCRFATEKLKSWFPNASCVFLGGGTRGAAFTALSGVTQCGLDEIICVDLADILYLDHAAPVSAFAENDRLGGLLLTFPSDNPIYSYAATDPISGRITRTAEKNVISGDASAGTYFFRNPETYLRSMSHAIRNADEQTYRDTFFVCPLMNGVIEAGFDVTGTSVDEVRDIKISGAHLG